MSPARAARKRLSLESYINAAVSFVRGVVDLAVLGQIYLRCVEVYVPKRMLHVSADATQKDRHIQEMLQKWF